MTWRSGSASSSASVDNETPRRRTPFVMGNSGSSSALPSSSSSPRVVICAWPVRLRVICRKLANLTLSVTVRPRIPERSQYSRLPPRRRRAVARPPRFGDDLPVRADAQRMRRSCARLTPMPRSCPRRRWRAGAAGCRLRRNQRGYSPLEPAVRRCGQEGDGALVPQHGRRSLCWNC